MKKKFFTLLLAVAASIGTMRASDTQVDGIWYDFTTGKKFIGGRRYVTFFKDEENYFIN